MHILNNYGGGGIRSVKKNLRSALCKNIRDIDRCTDFEILKVLLFFSARWFFLHPGTVSYILKSLQSNNYLPNDGYLFMKLLRNRFRLHIVILLPLLKFSLNIFRKKIYWAWIGSLLLILAQYAKVKGTDNLRSPLLKVALVGLNYR
jgi:hypothetical protein